MSLRDRINCPSLISCETKFLKEQQNTKPSGTLHPKRETMNPKKCNLSEEISRAEAADFFEGRVLKLSFEK
jgi:hypothetical protein